MSHFNRDTDHTGNPAGACCLPSRWKEKLKFGEQLVKKKEVIFSHLIPWAPSPTIHRSLQGSRDLGLRPLALVGDKLDRVRNCIKEKGDMELRRQTTSEYRAHTKVDTDSVNISSGLSVRLCAGLPGKMCFSLWIVAKTV